MVPVPSCGSLVDGLLAALLHGSVPGHSEQVVAQSEGRVCMCSDKLVIIIFKDIRGCL